MCADFPNVISKAAEHNFRRFEESLHDALLSEQLPLGFLLGAGCPVAVQSEPEDGGYRPLIPAIVGMTAQVTDKLKSERETREMFELLAKQFEDEHEPDEPNIEDLLSRVRDLQRVVGEGEARGLDRAKLDELETKICEGVAEIVSVRLPGSDTPYHDLSSWVSSVRRHYPVELFTTNYDLLLEQALEETQVPFFDGFVGSCQRFFDIHAMEKDSLPARWARVWKVHGSVNWWKRNDGRIVCRPKNPGGGLSKLLIHPSHLKYNQSRRMPYLAMQDRLVEFLEKSSSVLFTVGYSFSDEHLNELIFYTLRSNPSAQTFALMYDKLDNTHEELLTAANDLHNISVVCPDGGVFDRRLAEWSKPDESVHYGDFAKLGELFKEVTGVTRESDNGN